MRPRAEHGTQGRWPVAAWSLWLGLLAVLWVCAGCRREMNVTVTGTILRNGQPLPVSKSGSVQVTLMPDVAPDESYTTKVGWCESDGKFVITDVPPGKYRIGIEWLDPTPQDDKLKGLMTAQNSKIVREIDGKTPLTIDIAKPGP